MNAAEVAEYAMADYVAESDAEPRRGGPSVRALLGAIAVVWFLLAGYAWALGQAQRAGQRAVDADARADRLEAEMVLLQTRCTVFVDGSASCPAGVFEAGAAK